MLANDVKKILETRADEVDEGVRLYAEKVDVSQMPVESQRAQQALKLAILDKVVSSKSDGVALECWTVLGQAIGVGAGQQSRIHCTRLAGSKADIWWLRQHPKVLGLQFVDNIRRPDRDNAIDIYISDEHDDVLAEGVWQNTFKVKPEVLTAEEKAAFEELMALGVECWMQTTTRDSKEPVSELLKNY